MKTNIAVLITCFNRKEKTLKCLKMLEKQKVVFDTFVCDDGSTDGTFSAIKQMFPNVFLIRGTGNLFWNRGMLNAWEYAINKNQYDYFIWLNDDVELFDDAFLQLLRINDLCNESAIVCGACCSKYNNFTYGGKFRDGSPVIPNGHLQEIYYLNGNCVLVPISVVEKIGLLDKLFEHHLGDYDYGLRAIKAGIKVVSSTSYIGICESNDIIGDRSRKSNTNIWKRFKTLYSPLGYNPIIRFKYQNRHMGLSKAIIGFIQIHINNILSDKLFTLKTKMKKR